MLWTSSWYGLAGRRLGFFLGAVCASYAWVGSWMAGWSQPHDVADLDPSRPVGSGGRADGPWCLKYGDGSSYVSGLREGFYRINERRRECRADGLP